MKTTLVLAAAVTALAAAANPAKAAPPYPFCAIAGGYNSYENCGYPSFAACMAAVSGVGGYCNVNPRYHAYYRDRGYDDPPPRRRARGHRR